MRRMVAAMAALMLSGGLAAAQTARPTTPAAPPWSVQSAAPRVAPDPEAPSKGIFVPRPRGAGDSLDEAAVIVSTRDAAVVTRRGERLNGRVVGIGRDGVLRLSDPELDRETRVPISAVQEVQLSGAVTESGRDQVVLVNDDRLAGRVEGITDTDLALETSTAGLLKVPNRHVKQVAFAGATAGARLATDFRSGQMAPLRQVSGAWTVTEGVLRCSQGFSSFALSCEQKRAVTVALDYARAPRLASLALFASDATRGAGPALCLDHTATGFTITVWRKEGYQSTAAVIAGRPDDAHEVRFAYDPATAMARLWVAGKLAADVAVHGGPREGRLIAFTTPEACAIARVEVFDGVAPPLRSAGEEEANATVVFLTDRSRLSATRVVLDDGSLSAATAAGVVSVPVEKVAGILTARTDRVAAPPLDSPVQVVTAKGLLTVELIELTDKHLIGRSPCIGPIKLQRGAVRALRFTPSPPPKSSAP